MIAKFLTPYLAAVEGVLAVLLAAASLTAYLLFGAWQDAKDERDAALGRVATLLTALEIDGEIANMDDAAFDAALDGRLSPDGD